MQHSAVARRSRNKFASCNQVSAIALGLSGCALLLPAAAIAQSEPAPVASEQVASPQVGKDRPADAPTDALMGDIVVTATKQARAEVLQKVPLTVTAFGRTQLEALRLTNLQGLATKVAGASLDTGAAYVGFVYFTIRGVGSGVTTTASTAPAVGVFVDGVYMGLNQGILSDLWDLDGIEVVKGPQGILFGRNTTGGAILVRNAVPTQEFTFNARARVESGPEYSAAFTVGGGVTEKLSARMAVTYRHDLGYFNNVTLGDKHYGEQESMVMRPSLRFQPDDETDLVVNYEYGHLTGDGTPTIAWEIYGKQNNDVYNDFRSVTDLKWQSVSSNSTRDVALGDGRITNIFGWRKLSDLASYDADGTPFNIAPVAGYTRQSQISEELRYNGTFGPVRLTAGGYYYHQNLFQLNNQPLFNGTQGGAVREDVYAGFAQADIDVLSNVTLQLGGRYNYEKKNGKITRLGVESGAPRAGTFAPGLCNFSQRTCVWEFNLSDSWKSFLPKIGLQYRLSEAVQFYGSAQKAFRSGGFNVRYNSAAPPTAYNPEKQNAFEVGFKADLFDRATRINGAAFYTKVKQLQRDVSLFDAATLSSVSTTFNVGSAAFKGFDMEILQKVVPHVVFNGSVGYVDAHYTNITADITGDGVINSLDLQQRIARVSPWTWNVGLTGDHSFDFGNISANVSYSYRSAAYSQDFNFMRTDRGLPVYTGLFPQKDLGAQLTMTLAQTGLSMTVYGKNLLDTFTLATNNPVFAANGVPFGLPSGTTLRGRAATPNKGRVLGVEVNYKF